MEQSGFITENLVGGHLRILLLLGLKCFMVYTCLLFMLLGVILILTRFDFDLNLRRFVI